MDQPFEHVSFEKPDDVREGNDWRMELVDLAGGRPNTPHRTLM
jgi:hypothetical protein